MDTTPVLGAVSAKNGGQVADRGANPEKRVALE